MYWLEYMSRKIKRFTRFIDCGCGCKRLLLDLDNRGRPRKHIHGHNNHSINGHGPYWKGGIKIQDGYVLVHRPSHPFANSSGYVRLHRIIMEKHIGRYMTKDEQVHHINGVKSENLFCNMVLLTRSEHMRLHMIEKRRNDKLAKQK